MKWPLLRPTEVKGMNIYHDTTQMILHYSIKHRKKKDIIHTEIYLPHLPEILILDNQKIKDYHSVHNMSSAIK